MTQTGVGKDEPDPRLIGKPARIAIRLLVNDELIGEVTTERPSEVEARAFCRELQREIEALIHGGKIYVQ